MKRSVVNCFVHTLCLVLVFLVLETSSKECGDPQCESVIARGKAVLRFRGGGGQKVNLDQNEPVEILAKNVGKAREYIVRKSSGIIGLAPKDFIREYSIVIKSTDRIKFSDETADTNTIDIKPTQAAKPEENVSQTTVVDGTVLSNDVLSDSPSAEPAASKATTTVNPTPTLEVVPSTQRVEDNLPKEADVSKNETVEDADDGSEELVESDDIEEDEGDEEEEEEEDVSEEVEDDVPDTNNEAMKAEDSNAANVDADNGTSQPKATTEKVLPNDGHENATPAQTGTEEIQPNPDVAPLVKDTADTNKDHGHDDAKPAETDTDETQPNPNSSSVNSVESVPSTDQNTVPSMENTAGIQKEHGQKDVKPAEAGTPEVQPKPSDTLVNSSESVPSTIQSNVPSVEDAGDVKQETGADKVEENVGKDSATEQTASDRDKSTESDKNTNDASASGSEKMEPEKSMDTTTESPSASDTVTEQSEVAPVDEVTTPLSTVEMTEPEAPVTILPPEVATDVVQPVAAEPAPVTETEHQDAPIAAEVSKNSDSQPTHPNRILAGGLGNLLAHSHHHHHHHHPHHHHHAHHHHTHEHDHAHDHQAAPPKQVQTVGDTHLHFPAQVDMPQTTLPQDEDAGNVGQNADPFENNHLHSSDVVAPVRDLAGKSSEVSTENGYCDGTGIDCPPPAAPLVPPSIKHSNGGADYNPMDQDVRTNEGETEQGEDMAPDSRTEHLADGGFGEAKVQLLAGDYIDVFVQEAIKLSDLILMLAITSFTLLAFSLGHYLINKNRREKPLIYKLNMIERDLMTSYKESGLLKAELQETKHKLTSIENNSFGSNDMVIALKAELEAAEQAKLELQDQIAKLEKELKNATDAAMELNNMVAELLNQNGSDSIALSVEELQRQLNEQQQTFLLMNASLAEKSRENSELQIAIANQTRKFNDRLEELEKERTELTERRQQLEEEVASLQSEQKTKVDNLRKETGAEIELLTKELKIAQSRGDENRKTLAAMEAKCEALEECLKEVKADGASKGMFDSIELKAQIALLAKEKATMQDKLQGEIIARQLVEDHMKMVNEEISTLKREFGKAEKDKLEAETRLEVLSSYFKDKETQLQKELSVKEAMWMQQQGETTTTVEKIRHMQDELQQLKSQNDKLRAEIEAQATAHKAQYTTLETRSHDAWLTARQAERRLEEARSESSALRRKLTALGDISASSDGMVNLPNASITQTDIGLTAPSPIRVESPNAPQLLGVLPPPPFLPPFMPGPPPPFMPPFMPPPHGPGEMRPPPLGRLMSPPPPNNRYSPNNIIDARDRYSPDRGRYSPDSRYDYSVMSTYETENDFSPPPSPPHHTRHSNYDRDRERERERDRDSDRDRAHRDGRGSGSGGYSRGYTPRSMRTSPPIQDPRNKKYAGGFSSGSQDSLGTRKSSGKYRTTGKPVL